ncbi:UDP-glucuronosyl/UDP-glucosyltransferase [Sesbania bispinosa]|nr:UDP-glucuronosyl/UDP-glucosyltransferase [Sesbania bispinosa]
MDCFHAESGVEMLNAIFLPFISTSHLFLVVDTARLFAMHGVDVTIITTTANATTVQSSIDRDSSRGHPIRIHVVKFPQIDGLPEGMETIIASTPKDLMSKIYEGLSNLQGIFQQLFRDLKPDFIVTDMFYPWSVDVAAELGIPRMFVSASYMADCAMDSVERFSPHTKVDSDGESFVLPGLPHKLEMTRSQLPDWLRTPNSYTYLKKMIRESEKKSYGSLFHSFYEFEGPYEEHYKTVMGIKSWSLGPVSLWVNQDALDKAGRGLAKGDGKEQELLTWLDSKTEDSVLYVSFGSMNKFPTTQLVEIAHALEDSGVDFIWVVRKVDGDNGFLEEFEKRVKASNKGYLMWGWAPQLVILEHPATGEQFFNEKLLVDVLRIGVPVGLGAKEWKNLNEFGDEVVKREDIGKTIASLMGGGEESLEIRKRAKALSDAAKKAIQVGGSSHTNLQNLIQELKSLKLQKVNPKMEVVA